MDFTKNQEALHRAIVQVAQKHHLIERLAVRLKIIDAAEIDQANHFGKKSSGKHRHGIRPSGRAAKASAKNINNEDVPNSARFFVDPKLKLPDNRSDDMFLYLVLSKVSAQKERLLWLLVPPSDTSLPKTLDLKQRLASRGFQVDIMGIQQNELDLVQHNVAKATRESKIKSKDDESRYQEDFDKLLLEAKNRNASDIHIEIRRDTARIRFRENGQVIGYNRYSVEYAMNLVRVIYTVVAEEKQPTFTPKKPQDAVANRIVQGSQIRVRIATIPAYPQGVDMVLRLLPMGLDREVLSLEQLGYTKEHRALLNRAAQRPVGCFIISGSTGSGKSTTLKHIIGAKVNEYDGRIKIITVEDPPEYQMFGVTQSPVVRTTEDVSENANPFTMAIRASMRCDPDILLVGEVRDSETARLLISAVQSGHQAFTTIHASSATGIVQRMQGMGIPPDVIGSGDFIGVLVNQSLVPTVCKKCATPASKFDFEHDDTTREMYQRLEVVMEGGMTVETSPILMHNKEGCSSCKGTGIAGRRVVAEVLLPDEEIRSIFASGDIAKARIYWLTQMGGFTILEDGINKMMDGDFDPFHLEHKVGPLDEVAGFRALRIKYKKGDLRA